MRWSLLTSIVVTEPIVPVSNPNRLYSVRHRLDLSLGIRQERAGRTHKAQSDATRTLRNTTVRGDMFCDGATTQGESEGGDAKGRHRFSCRESR